MFTLHLQYSLPSIIKLAIIVMQFNVSQPKKWWILQIQCLKLDRHEMGNHTFSINGGNLENISVQ